MLRFAFAGILKPVEFKRQTRPSRQPVTPQPPNTVVAPVPDSVVDETPARRRKRLPKLVILLLVVLLVAAGGWAAWNYFKASSIPKEPDYKTVVPKDKTVSELGGWKLISPPGKEPVFAYGDTIDGIPISVSQQPLPAGSQVAEIAQKFNATDKIDADGTTVYVGTSSKGPQSAIFTKNNLLVLIKSESKVSPVSWSNYVKTLK